MFIIAGRAAIVNIPSAIIAPSRLTIDSTASETAPPNGSAIRRGFHRDGNHAAPIESQANLVNEERLTETTWMAACFSSQS